jgi:hypothetical protein
MDQLAFDRALEREIADRLAAGEDAVTRLITMQWFTFDLEGEDLVVGEDMQRAIEEMAGAPLIEYTPCQYPMMVGLGFDPKVRSVVRERLAQLPKPTHSVTPGPLEPESIAP